MRDLKLKNNGKKKQDEKALKAVAIKKKNWWEPDPDPSRHGVRGEIFQPTDATATETPDYSKIHSKDGPKGKGGVLSKAEIAKKKQDENRGLQESYKTLSPKKGSLMDETGRSKAPDHRKKDMQKTIDKVNANSGGAGNVLNQAPVVKKDKTPSASTSSQMSNQAALNAYKKETGMVRKSDETAYHNWFQDSKYKD